MAFDAGMLACALWELRSLALDARIEKIYQPERDEIVIQMRSREGGKRLLIHTGSGNPRIGFTTLSRENPPTPPAFCMLLRRYLQGAKLSEVRMPAFDRVAYLGFDTRDEMGYECRRYLIVELMGRYANLLFADGELKILSSIRPSALSLDSLRPMVPGMKYVLPPVSEDRRDPLCVTESELAELLGAQAPERRCDSALVSSFSGLSPLVAREIVFRATGHTDTPVRYCFADDVWRELSAVVERIRSERFEPCMIVRDGQSVEYSFLPISQYPDAECVPFASVGELFDVFFERRDRENVLHQRASDLLRLLSTAQNRIHRKLELQRAELAECERGEDYKRLGDLIVANLYRLSYGQSSALLEDYAAMTEDGTVPTVAVELDPRLSPSANAQRYYKRYQKAKSAKIALAEQIELARSELAYLGSVEQSLQSAATPSDLMEIRDELYRSGYASRMRSYSPPKHHTPSFLQFSSPDGLKILCGKNNVQNEYITHRLAKKHDYWFHAKGVPGSHVLLVTEGKEPSDADFTAAAQIAARFSSAKGQNVPVDYTLAKHVKKPSGAKPGFVIYHTNWTAYVNP